MEFASAKTAEILIDGEWAPARTTDARRVLTSPATLTPICGVPECSADELAAAASAARRSLPGWASRSAADRAALLEQVGREILRHTAQLADLHARETGQVFCESLDCVRAAAAFFRRVAQAAPGGQASLGESAPFRGGCVVAVVTAAQYPLLDWACSVSRLLALGSTVVCIPPLGSPLTTLAAAACLAALPAGVINVVTASDALARTLTRLEGIDCVAARPGERATTDFVFVSESANLDLAVAGAASLRLFSNGQRPGQSACIYVERSLADTFTERLHEFMAFLEAGDPCRRATDLGPLRSAATLAHVEEAVGRALRKGARLKLGGRRYQPWGLRGYFFQPTILIDRSEQGLAGEDHIAGPVVILSPVPDIAAAVRARQRSGARSRVALFAGEPAAQLRVLEAAGLDARTRGPMRSIERVCADLEHCADGPDQLRIELIAGPRPDWLPYRRRPPQMVEGA